jgi:hypothetical protein
MRGDGSTSAAARAGAFGLSGGRPLNDRQEEVLAMKYIVPLAALSLLLAGCAAGVADDVSGDEEDIESSEAAACSTTLKAFGYAWVDDPWSLSSVPSATYRHNSSGGSIVVQHTGPGAHKVTFQGLAPGGQVGGTAHVTSYGSSGEACKVQGWQTVGTDITVSVLCFNAVGTPLDTRFNIAYGTQPSEVSAHAYLWANDPVSASYTPDPTYQYNTTCAANQMQHGGPGTYLAKFPGLADGHQGTLKITAYGKSSDYCKVLDWWTSGPDVLADLRCRTAAGVHFDGQLTATYTRKNNLFGQGTGNFGYAYVDWSALAPLNRQYNSTGPANSVVHPGPGAYQVKFPGLGVTGGHVQVTAAGQTDTRCQSGGWTASGGDQVAFVYCHDHNGVLTDSPFTVSYQRL